MEHMGLRLWQREGLSLPLQAFASYDRLYGDELSDDEINVINKVLTYDGLSEGYEPEHADFVKDRWNQGAASEEKLEFFKLWLRKLKEHPDAYISGVVNDIYGCLYPFHYNTALGIYQFYNKNSITDNDADIIYSKYVFSDDVRTAASDAVYAWNKLPILSSFTNCASYVWALIILFGGMLRKRRWKICFIYTPPALVVLVCMAASVNELLRYMLPVVAAMPLFVLVGIEPYVSNINIQTMSASDNPDETEWKLFTAHKSI